MQRQLKHGSFPQGAWRLLQKTEREIDYYKIVCLLPFSLEVHAVGVSNSFSLGATSALRLPSKGQI